MVMIAAHLHGIISLPMNILTCELKIEDCSHLCVECSVGIMIAVGRMRRGTLHANKLYNMAAWVKPLPQINQIKTTEPVVHKRVPKVMKKRRKNSSPNVSQVVEKPKKNQTNTHELICLQIPKVPSTGVHTHLTKTNFDFSPPGFPIDGEGPEYLEMVKCTLQLIVHVSCLHSALYENPSNKQIHKHQHLRKRVCY